MQLFIVRHGETIWNRLGKMQGQNYSPLTKEGIKQAAELSAKLGTVKIRTSFWLA